MDLFADVLQVDDRRPGRNLLGDAAEGVLRSRRRRARRSRSWPACTRSSARTTRRTRDAGPRLGVGEDIGDHVCDAPRVLAAVSASNAGPIASGSPLRTRVDGGHRASQNAAGSPAGATEPAAAVPAAAVSAGAVPAAAVSVGSVVPAPADTAPAVATPIVATAMAANASLGRVKVALMSAMLADDRGPRNSSAEVVPRCLRRPRRSPPSGTSSTSASARSRATSASSGSNLGCRWAEGPVYVPAGRYLLVSDIPNDRIMRWDETTGAIGVFRHPAGYANGNTLDGERPVGDVRARQPSCHTHRARRHDHGARRQPPGTTSQQSQRRRRPLRRVGVVQRSGVRHRQRLRRPSRRQRDRRVPPLPRRSGRRDVRNRRRRLRTSERPRLLARRDAAVRHRHRCSTHSPLRRRRRRGALGRRGAGDVHGGRLRRCSARRPRASVGGGP